MSRDWSVSKVTRSVSEGERFTVLTTKSLPIVQIALKELIAQDAKRAAAAPAARGPGGFGPGPGGPGGMFGGGPPLETFLVKRRESITAQLAGKSKGKTPGMSFGPPGGGGPGGFGPPGGGPGGGGFGMGNFHGPQILAAADADKDQKLSRKEARFWPHPWSGFAIRGIMTFELTPRMARPDHG